ncbi:MAG: 30S ribosome-binding factor RbfA [Mycoplasma sp.]|nr:30S ribosome-binding factor RbfA [Mycoplasma sp.]
MNEIQRRKKEANYLLWIAKILNEDVTNSNVKNVTVVDVKLSNDGSNLKVYVLFDKNENKSIIALNNISGFIKKQLSNYDYESRRIPNIIFEIDDVFKKSMRIEEILKKINSDN